MGKLKLTNGEISVFCTELALLLHSGVSLSDGLAALAEEAAPKEKPLLSAMAERLSRGERLSDAMRASALFPAYVSDLAACGERTGRPEEALRALADYYDGRRRLENSLRSALLYPAVLLLLMLVIIAVLLMKVLPIFNDVFASLGGSLTGLAGGLLSLGQALDAALPALCAVLAVLVLALALFAASAEFRAALLRLWRRLRGGKGLPRQIQTARFARVLAMGLQSGLHAEEAVELASTFETDEAAGARSRACLRMLERGDGLAQALRENDCLPAADCRMLSLGVRAGTGDTVMGDIASRLEEDCDAAVESRVARVEPTLVIVTSLLVGVILLSVMLPLMNIMAAIG